MDLQELVEFLKTEVRRKEYLDVGHGVEDDLGVSRFKLKSALAILTDEGYNVYTVKMRQTNNDNFVTLKVLTESSNKWTKAFNAVQSGELKSVEVKV